MIVAAGFSSRANGWKMAFDIGGLTVIERCVLGMAPYCSRIFVIGGDRFNILQGLLPKLKYPAVELIFNPNYHHGMFSSILAGFRRVRATKFFFIPGDYPLVSGIVYKMLLKQDGAIIIPSYQGVTGHPVLFQTDIIKGLLNVPNKFGNLREFLVSQSYRTIEVPDQGILMDIDTKQDYRRAVRHFYFKR